MNPTTDFDTFVTTGDDSAAASKGYDSVKGALSTSDCSTVKYDGPADRVTSTRRLTGRTAAASAWMAVSDRVSAAVPDTGRIALKWNGCGIVPLMLAVVLRFTRVTPAPSASAFHTRTTPATSKPGPSFGG